MGPNGDVAIVSLHLLDPLSEPLDDPRLFRWDDELHGRGATLARAERHEMSGGSNVSSRTRLILPGSR